MKKQEPDSYRLEQLHAVLVPFPLVGHVRPCVELARKLAKRGVLVTVANFHNIIASLQKKQKQKKELKNDGRQEEDGEELMRFVGLPDGLPEDHPRNPASYEYFQAVQKNMAGPLQAYIQKQQRQSRAGDGGGEEVPITCIIADAFLPWTRDVAEALNLSRVLLWTSSAATFSICRHGDLLVRNGIIQAPARSDFTPPPPDALIDYIPGLPPLTPADLPSVLQAGDWRTEFLQTLFQRTDDALCMLVHSVYELEKGVFDELHNINCSPPLLPVGPLYSSPPSSEDEADKECLAWLGQQERESVVYISWGTLYRAKRQEIEEIAAALEMMEGQAFLWVVGSDNRPDDGMLDAFRERTEARGKVVPWAPQTTVLEHPSTGAFVSHCGWNSTLESVLAGVPIVAWPRDAEQATNAKFIEDEWRVGVRLPHVHPLHRDDLCKAIQMVTMDPEFRLQMRELSISCSTSSSSHSSVDGFLRSMRFETQKNL